MTREEYFCSEFVDKIYYYCLKKTGTTEEAEDLGSEIVVEVLTALSKGVLTEHFEGWVWRIAHNRYARWAKKKHIKSENETFDDEALMAVASSENIEEDVLRAEQLSELRRELSLISKDYRELIVAYYVENRSISMISRSLSIPEGTVKTKLFKARQRLREGMAMARTFGKLSYAPEDIDFRMGGGSGRDDEPHKFFEDEMYSKICKNIMIEAYRNPSTMQELSIELGIAMPYLGDFVEAMTEATLLVKSGSGDKARYETNFVIVSSEAHRKMNDKLAGISRPFVKLAKEYLEKSRELQLAAGNHILGEYQDYEEQKWTLALRLADDIQWGIYGKKELGFKFGSTVRPNGGTWDVMGIQEYKGPQFMGIGHTSGKTDGYPEMVAFVTDKQAESEFDKTLCAQCKNIQILNHIIRKEYDEPSIRELIEVKEFIKKDANGEYVVRFGLYNKAHNRDGLKYGVPVEVYNKELLSLWEEMWKLGDEYITYCEEVMKEEVPERLSSQFKFCMNMIPFLRGMVAEGLVEAGFLKPEEELSQMIGVYTTVE